MATTIDMGANPAFATARSIEAQRMQSVQPNVWRQMSSANPRQDTHKPDEEPVCANCGGAISPDNLACPPCGISLVAG